MKSILSIVLLTIVMSVSVFGQMESQRIHWKLETGKIGEKEYVLQFKASPEKHWHLYGVRDELSSLYITYEDSSLIEFHDSIVTVPKGELVFDELMFANREQFDGETWFLQKVKVKSDGSINIKGFVDYQTCIEIEDGRCLLEKQEFNFKLDPTTTPEVDLNKLISEATEKLKITEKSHVDDNTTESETGSEEIIVTGDDGDVNYNEMPLYMIFLIAFGAGLIAIFTPCVLPMVPMTVTFFMKSSENKKKGRKQAFMYGFSILFIFTIIGSLMSIIFGINSSNG